MINSKIKTLTTLTTGKTLREAAQHHYTVGYINVCHEPKAAQGYTHYSNPPALHLKDNWLEQAGFTTRQPVIITAKKSKLVVELAK